MSRRSSGRALELVLGVLALGFALMVATVPLAFSLLASVGLVSLLARAPERHAVTLVSGTVLGMILEGGPQGLLWFHWPQSRLVPLRS